MDVLKQVFTLGKTIYDRVKKVKSNKQACEYLAKRIEVIMDGLREVQEKTPDYEKKMKKGLISLEETLRSALDLVEECDNAGQLSMFFKAGSYQDRFEEVNRRLSRNQQDLTLSGHGVRCS